MSFKKVIKKVFFYGSIISVIIVALALIFAYLYEDKIKDFTIKQINKNIDTKILVKKIDFSLFNNFPKASLNFNEVAILDKKSDSINIIKIIEADRIYFSFDIMDIINGIYNINDIVINNAIFNLTINKDGTNNFNFISTNQEDSSSYFLNLTSVEIVNTVFNYKNIATHQEASILIEEVDFSGEFMPANFNITLDGRTKLKIYRNRGRNILKDKNIDLKVQLVIDTKTGYYNLKKGFVRYQGIPLNLNGEIELFDKSIGINATLNTNNISVSQIIKNLPKETKSLVENYDLEGVLDIKANIKGKFGGKYIPKMDISMNLMDFSFIIPDNNIKFNSLSANVEYSNGQQHNLKSSSLSIKSLSTKSNIGKISGDFNIYNFWKPSLRAKFYSTLDLAEIQAAINIDTISILKGDIDLSSDIGLKLIFNDSGNWEIFNLSMKNKFEIKNAKLVLDGSDISYDSIYMKAELLDNNMNISKLRFNSGNTDLLAKGTISNLPISTFYRGDDMLRIKLILSANTISFKQIMSSLPSSKTADTRFSDELSVDIGFSFKEFVYDNIITKNTKGNFSMHNRKISIRNIGLNVFEGAVNSDLFIDGSTQNRYLMKSQGSFNKVRIDQVFGAFNNFEQDVLTDKNISGELTSSYIISMNFDKDWKINSHSIELTSDIVIEDGVLRDMKSLDALKSYTKIDDFSVIKFSTIKNSISVKNSLISIPNMDINSDKMGLNLRGTHNFDNEYEYHVSVLLSEVMGKKYEKTLSTEFGEIENDANGRSKLFFTIISRGDDFEVKYDKSGLKKKLKEDLSEEKSSLKDALNKEFGWFKKEEEKQRKDSVKAVKAKEKENTEIKEGGFSIEWDDDDEETENPPE